MFKRRKPDEVPAFDQAPSGQDAVLFPRPAPPRALTPEQRQPVAATSAQRLTDNGLGVPPFRPAHQKDVPEMAKPPMPSPMPGSGLPPLPSVPMRPSTQPARPARDGTEKRTLVVGRGISVQGTVQDAERLVVEGTVEATMIQAAELSIAQGGMFKGEVEVEDAEIAGTIDGTLLVRGNLVVRASGKVLGTARCRRLQVEDGGAITGRIEMLSSSEPSRQETPRAEPARQDHAFADVSA